ncbi:MAG TPA: hypothetical protein VFA18_00060, partial [Gemmataceae bacterium]|nr:hypothetical protein [Gemmataceae bacterium]
GCGGCGCGPWGFGFNVGGHISITGAPCGGGALGQAGPWFSYYPYEAYFQTPAPYPSYPYWVGSGSVAVVPAAPALTVPTAPPPATVPLPPPQPGPAGAPLPPPQPGPAAPGT